MPEGWIKIFRKFTEWEWYTDSFVKSVFIHLLITANYETKRWRGRVIRPGQLITSAQHLAMALNMDRKTVFNALRSLQETKEIEVESKKGRFGYLFITINNYNAYQVNEGECGTIDGTNDGLINGTIDGHIGGTIDGTNDGLNLRSKEDKKERIISDDDDDARVQNFASRSSRGFVIPKSENEMLQTDHLIGLLTDEKFNQVQLESLAMKFDLTPHRVAEIVDKEFRMIMGAKGMTGNTLSGGRTHLFNWFVDYQARQAREQKQSRQNGNGVSTIHFEMERKTAKLNVEE